jgi:hypothetical protein
VAAGRLDFDAAHFFLFTYPTEQIQKKPCVSMFMNIRRSGFVWWLFCAAAVGVPTLVISRGAEPNKPSATAQQTGKLDSLTGFRDQKFGTPFSEFQGLTLEQDKGAIKLYSKKDDNLTLGLVKLQAIVYHFFQDKFYAVSLHTGDRENTLGLLRVAVAAFGTGDRRQNAADDLDQSWQGKSAEAFFNVNPRTDQGSLFIRDGQLGGEVEAYRDQATKEAADQL